jgi:hypothetical protein
VATLVNEVQQLGAGRPAGGAAPAARPALEAPAAGALDADAVISSRLVVFHNIQARLARQRRAERRRGMQGCSFARPALP